MKIQRLLEHLKSRGMWTPDLKIRVMEKSCGIITESVLDTGIKNCVSRNREIRSLNESLEKPVYAWSIKNGTVTIKTFED